MADEITYGTGPWAGSRWRRDWNVRSAARGLTRTCRACGGEGVVYVPPTRWDPPDEAECPKCDGQGKVTPEVLKDLHAWERAEREAEDAMAAHYEDEPY